MHKKLIVSLALNILLLGVVLGAVGMRLYQPQVPENVSSYPVISPSQSVLIPTPFSQIPSDPGSFQEFTELFADVVPLLEQSQFDELSQMQSLSEVTCDSQSPYHPDICNGHPDGTRVSGWLIGYEASEGSIYSQEQFIDTLTQYEQQHGPFIYGSNSIERDHGSITLYSRDRQWKLAVVISKDNPEQIWRVQYTLLGLNLEQQ